MQISCVAHTDWREHSCHFQTRKTTVGCVFALIGTVRYRHRQIQQNCCDSSVVVFFRSSILSALAFVKRIPGQETLDFLADHQNRSSQTICLGKNGYVTEADTQMEQGVTANSATDPQSAHSSLLCVREPTNAYIDGHGHQHLVQCKTVSKTGLGFTYRTPPTQRAQPRAQGPGHKAPGLRLTSLPSSVASSRSWNARPGQLDAAGPHWSRSCDAATVVQARCCPALFSISTSTFHLCFSTLDPLTCTPCSRHAYLTDTICARAHTHTQQPARRRALCVTVPRRGPAAVTLGARAALRHTAAVRWSSWSGLERPEGAWRCGGLAQTGRRRCGVRHGGLRLHEGSRVVETVSPRWG